MNNNIAQIRSDIAAFFDSMGMIENSEEVKLSESGLFYYSSTLFRQKDKTRNWIVSKIEIWNTEAAEKIFEFITDNDSSHDCSLWISTNEGNEYLFLPEFQTGYSVFDVSSGQLHSFDSKDDPFIWMRMFPSPDKTKLAVTGCYWACPYEIRIYDIKDITNLPYPLLYQDTVGALEFDKWIDNKSFTLIENNNKQKLVYIPDLDTEHGKI